MGNKKLNPPEYKSEEEQEKADIKFGVMGLISRMVGFIHSFKELSQNKDTNSRVDLRVPVKKE
eukprot:CAMPEP_0168628126 /NCGR_PEP_ID=MMETSP0449_2-20121227/11672_1 /TAXON_ID=1082188 /ORGANISM="Strombidium rassoulzadegani, Strain ras09" /LENGTH=62 /DNA_ID=CAMNT_0008670513 /DNA_START=145 /DNA_END=333 /DNA_ORIENTATION=-